MFSFFIHLAVSCSVLGVKNNVLCILLFRFSPLCGVCTTLKETLFVDSSWWSWRSQVFRFWFESARRWKRWRTVSAVFRSRFGRWNIMCMQRCINCVCFCLWNVCKCTFSASLLNLLQILNIHSFNAEFLASIFEKKIKIWQYLYM